MCHLNIHPGKFDLPNSAAAAVTDYLSNMTPHSVLHNETVLRLRRTKRSTATTATDLLFYNKSHKSVNKMRYINDEGSAALHGSAATNQKTNQFPATASTMDAFVVKVVRQSETDEKKNNTTSTSEHHHINVTAAHEQHAKINSEKHWRFVKNKIRQKIKFIDSHNQPPMTHHASMYDQLITNSAGATTKVVAADCQRLSNYAWLFILSYVLFALSLYTFLSLSESTVFTVTIITSGLPLIGIFWSMFELQTIENAGMYLLDITIRVIPKLIEVQNRFCNKVPVVSSLRSTTGLFLWPPWSLGQN